MQSLRKRRFFKHRPPSYISFANFFTILSEFISPKNGQTVQQMIDDLPIGNFKSVMNIFYQEAAQNEDIFKARVELWFNDMMNRVTGWYKRTAQIILFFLGMGLAICFNANIFSMYERLASNPAATEKIVTIAEDVIEQPSFIKMVNATNRFRADSLATKSSQDSILSRFNALMKQTTSLVHNNIESATNPLGLGWKSYNDTEKYANGMDRNKKEWLSQNYNWLANYCLSCFSWRSLLV